MAFKVETPDGAWHNTDDLTGLELRAIEAATGTSWSVLNPFREIDAYQAIVAAFAVRAGMSDAEIVDWFNARSAKDLLAGLDVAVDGDDLPETYEDGAPLVGADESSTTSSADSPNPHSAGRPT